jgi:hypothetical protein
LRFTRFVIGGTIAAAAVSLGAFPAYANGPPSPPVQSGCTFDGLTGQTTCITTQTTGPTAYTIPPVTDPLPGGVTATQLCDSIEGTSLRYILGLTSDASIAYTATSTTMSETVHQGVSPNGHQVSGSTTTTASDVTVTAFSGVTCLPFNPH